MDVHPWAERKQDLVDRFNEAKQRRDRKHAELKQFGRFAAQHALLSGLINYQQLSDFHPSEVPSFLTEDDAKMPLPDHFEDRKVVVDAYMEVIDEIRSSVK